MKRTYFLTLVLAAAIAGGCGRDDNERAAAPGAGSAPVGTSGDAAADVSRGDQDFVHDAAIAGMAEIDMARMALDRSRDANVKKFAQMMIDDHTKAGNDLKSVAMRHRIEVPAQVDDDHRDKAEALGKKSGAEFDQAYAEAMVDGHQDLVDKLESRIDKDTLAEWKSKHVDSTTGRKMEGKGEAITVVPEKSDDPVTLSLNEWAAATYPTAFAHLQAAKDLQKGANRRTTTP
jgi:putative membrane protein